MMTGTVQRKILNKGRRNNNDNKNNAADNNDN